MTKFLLTLLGAYYGLGGLYMLLAPGHFYNTVPGVSLTGPLNHHFATDIAFAMLASAVLFLWSVRSGAAELAVGAAIWPVLHGIAHVGEWTRHTAAPAHVLAVDLAATVLPALLAGAAAATMLHRSGKTSVRA